MIKASPSMIQFEREIDVARTEIGRRPVEVTNDIPVFLGPRYFCRFGHELFKWMVWQFNQAIEPNVKAGPQPVAAPEARQTRGNGRPGRAAFSALISHSRFLNCSAVRPASLTMPPSVKASTGLPLGMVKIRVPSDLMMCLLSRTARNRPLKGADRITVLYAGDPGIFMRPLQLPAFRHSLPGQVRWKPKGIRLLHRRCCQAPSAPCCLATSSPASLGTKRCSLRLSS